MRSRKRADGASDERFVVKSIVRAQIYESPTSVMVPNSEGAAYFGLFHPNGLLPAHHLRKVNLSGDRLLGAGVEAF